MVEIVYKDIMTPTCDFICHQVNCQGKMNAGLAKKIREKWPQVYINYMEKFQKTDSSIWHNFLGDVQIVSINENKNPKFIINLFAQNRYGQKGRYTSYDAFWICLNQIAKLIPKGSSIAFPYGIGCGLGGADWKVIYTMIVKVLEKDYDIIIYKYME